MAEEPVYHMRDARSSLNDTDFITAAFDSTLPYLASIGGGEMWGKVPFSEKDGFLEETRASIEQSESYHQTGLGEKLRMFIMDVRVGIACLDELREPNVQTSVDEDGETWLSVAAVCVHENWIPEYIASQSNLNVPISGQVYIEFMIADHRTGTYHKGAGAMLLQQIQQYYKNKGFRTMYVDAWADNGRKLVDYYQQLGFQAIGDFKMGRGDGKVWHGTMLQAGL